MGVKNIVKEAEKILKNNNAPPYNRVFVYKGCTEEMCGEMPRVIVQWKDSVAVCYSLRELKKKYEKVSL